MSIYICPVCKNKNQKKFKKYLDDTRGIPCLEDCREKQEKNKFCNDIKCFLKIPLQVECQKCLEKDWEERFTKNIFTREFLFFNNFH